MHYFILIIVILLIISIQIRFYAKTRIKQKELSGIFTNQPVDKIYISEEDDISIIKHHDHCKNKVFQVIVNSINDYLIKNKAAASDFQLIKDIVDRNCDTEEEAIDTLIPIPLYLGLIGTMIGILVGVGSLVTSGGINDLLNTNDTSINGIEELLGGVALAMISSISGIILTTISSYKTQKSRTELNNNKNAFLSWIQVKLLPTLSHNSTTAIYTLQQNLNIFNKTFSSNIKQMENVFSIANQSHHEQLELMQLIEQMDVTKMAKSNIVVLQEIQKSTQEFETFNQYLHSLTSYLYKVEKLSAQVNEYLDRTQVIEEMGLFFKNEATQIEQRKAAISQSVGSVDVALQNAFKILTQNTEKSFDEFIKNSTEQQTKLNKITEGFEGKAEQMVAIVEELKNLTSVKEGMHNLEKAMTTQNKNIINLIQEIQGISFPTVVGSANAPSFKMPRWSKMATSSKIIAATSGGVIGTSYILWMISIVKNLF